MKYNLEYSASPTFQKFHRDNSFVRGVRGPIGSGKSTGCCWEIMLSALDAEPCTDGIKRSKWAVIRNTGPELESTTLRTWLDLFPVDSKISKINRKPPITYTFKTKNIYLEVLFLACDRPEDVKKLLSLEATSIFFNEAAKIHEEIFRMALGRVGRYPSQKLRPKHLTNKQFPKRYGVILDTNPPDTDHWWHYFAEENKPKNWNFYAQPSGRSKSAENIENLPNGYYENLMAGQSEEWIKVFVDGEYGRITTGKPVYGSSFKEELHCSKELLKPIPNVALDIGLDFGNTPAALITQITSVGQRIILEELVTVDTSIQDFANILLQALNKDYKECTEYNFYGDPSGDFKDQQQKTAFDLLRSNGIRAKPAPSNKIEMRIEAVKHELSRLVNGEPAYLINSKKCPMLVKGFKGGYEYKRYNVSGEKYDTKPNKNKYSHIHDANQYVLLSTGSYDMIVKNKRFKSELKPTVVNTNFNIYA